MEGFPHGDVLAWKAPVVFNFLKMLPEIESFQLSDMEGQPVYQTRDVKGAFTLSAGLVQPGKDYQWQFSAGGSAIKGRFHTQDLAASALLAEELSEIDKDPALNAGERKALAAMVFDRTGLIFDRDRLMAEVVSRSVGPVRD